MSPTSADDRLGWKNFSLRTKLSILLVCCAALPVILVTEGIVSINKNSSLRELKQSLQREGERFAQEQLRTQLESQTKAENLANLVQATTLDLSNPAQVSARLKNYLKIKNGLNTKSNKSFQIITDAQGRTVAQDIQILSPNSSQPLPASAKALTPKYVSVSLPTGIYLGDIPIVRDALSTGRPLAGMELLKSEPLQRLGLDKQADISWQTQPTQNLPNSKQPFPQKKYNLDPNAGLVCMAVYPIKISNKLVGTAIVGTLLNRNYVLVDEFVQNSSVAVATIFAQDVQVNTNVPYTDGQRAIGTRAVREVAEIVLYQGRDFSGKTNILGKQYLTFYSPLYDHQKELNPTKAKPVGMAFVGKTWLEVERSLLKQAIIGYSVAGSILLLASLIATGMAKFLARPLERLAGFSKAEKASLGALPLTPPQLEPTKCQADGVFSSDLDVMTTSEANLRAVHPQEALLSQEVEKERLLKERLQQEMIKLLFEIEGLQRGDLTVRADVKEDELGSVADAFNAVISSLQQIVIQVQTAAKQLHESALYNEASGQKRREEATTQAQAVAEAQKFVEEISQSIAAIASSAQKAMGIARQALLGAKYGDKTLEQTASSIEALHTNIAETSGKTKLLAESYQKISKIVSTISGISQKTNILTYNAAVEAARTGENSQGFRLVAEEVRRLAEQVTNSTREIEQLVSTIQHETTNVLQTMEASTAQVETSTYWVAKTKQTLQALALVSKEIDQLMQFISASTVSQAQSSRTVNQIMKTVAATLETTSSESEAVLSQRQVVEIAKALQNSVSQFRVEK